jgi:phage terminase large subunit-like protein
MSITARLMGSPYMPWQQYVADVMGEVDPVTGIKVYREGYLTTMRQVGKTRFVITYKVTTCLDTPTPVRVQFAAQEGKSAIAKMTEHAEIVRRTPLGRMLAADTPTTSNGKEHVEWANGSTEWPLTEKESSGHGDTIAAGFITEAMAHRDDRYIQTMQPAMNVNPNAQLFVESTQGNVSSVYWNEQTQELRERFVAEDGRLGRVAFFDWSFADDDDPFSEETWRHRIPSIGHTLRIEEVQHAADNATTPKKVRAFKRGFGNIADLGAGESSIFDEDAWESAETDDVIAGFRVLTFDVTNDRSWSSLAWAGRNTAGDMQSELVKHERSTHWVVAAAGKIFDNNPKMARRIYCVPGGQAVTLTDAFTRAGIELVILGRSDYAGAAGEYHAGSGDREELEAEDPAPRIYHTGRAGQEPLHVAVAGAVWTKDKAPVWDTLRTTTILSPLVACSIAPWAHQIELERKPVEDILQTFG